MDHRVRMCAATHAAENEEVEEVHPTEDEEHHAYLHRQRFDALLCRADNVPSFRARVTYPKLIR